MLLQKALTLRRGGAFTVSHSMLGSYTVGQPRSVAGFKVDTGIKAERTLDGIHFLKGQFFHHNRKGSFIFLHHFPIIRVRFE